MTDLSPIAAAAPVTAVPKVDERRRRFRAANGKQLAEQVEKDVVETVCPIVAPVGGRPFVDERV